MGWADCGTDSTGRPIGYAFEAVCDEPGCTVGIDRGLSYACGDMHGEDVGCERYFCEKHLSHLATEPWADGRAVAICTQCQTEMLESGDWTEDPEDGVLRRNGTELKPCPFCGSVAEVLCDAPHDTVTVYQAVCMNHSCGVLGPARATSEAAREDWNARSRAGEKP